MVMEAALNKFHARLGSYMPARNRFSLANRVKIANTYLIPVFSYLFRFFLDGLHGHQDRTWTASMADKRELHQPG